MHRIRLALVSGFAAVALAAVGAAPASAQTNNQSGLVNVNVQDLALQVPASVAVPVSVAANVCGVDVNVLANALNNGPVSCTATSDSSALNTAVANAMTGQGGGGGGASNHQSGLVNVNLQDVAIQVPVSVAVPVGVAANVCGVNANVLASQLQNGGASCTANSTSQALSNAIAGAIV